MEPKLIEKKVLKRLLKKLRKKNKLQRGGAMNMDFFNDITLFVKDNWYILLIIIFIVIIFIQLYIDNKKKKEMEHLEILKLQAQKNQKVETFKDGYVSEYYKMLPRVTNSPEIHEYRY